MKNLSESNKKNQWKEPKITSHKKDKKNEFHGKRGKKVYTRKICSSCNFEDSIGYEIKDKDVSRFFCIACYRKIKPLPVLIVEGGGFETNRKKH